jgi:hypothetical protein
LRKNPEAGFSVVAVKPPNKAGSPAAEAAEPRAGTNTDFAEVDPGLNPLRYPDGWGFGLASYGKAIYKGKELLVAKTPGISQKRFGIWWRLRTICALGHVIIILILAGIIGSFMSPMISN